VGSEHLHAVAVEGVEALHGVAVLAVPERSVGEHAVDIEDHHAHALRALQVVLGKRPQSREIFFKSLWRGTGRAC
jgi:hypothetical protein